MDQDVQIKITDRDGKLHEIAAPTRYGLEHHGSGSVI